MYRSILSPGETRSLCVGFASRRTAHVRVGHRQAPARPVLKNKTPPGTPGGVLFFKDALEALERISNACRNESGMSVRTDNNARWALAGESIYAEIREWL